MASGRYTKICDISRLDNPVTPRTSKYIAEGDANLCNIIYTERFPGDKQVTLFFTNETSRGDFLKLFTKRILPYKIQLDSLIILVGLRTSQALNQ